MDWFVGIDVSKATLDAVLLGPNDRTHSFTVSNNRNGHTKLMKQVHKLTGQEKPHWCMEASGAYHWEISTLLQSSEELVSVENPRRVKHYAVAIGAVQKTDRADAKAIAQYARAMKPQGWRLAGPLMQELMFLDRRVTDLERLITQERNRLEHPGLPKLVVAGINRSIKEFERQIAGVQTRIEKLVEQDEELAESCRLLETIPGIAKRSAIGLLVEAGDMSRYENAEDLAASFGLQPKLRKSGTSLNGRTRISKQGNAHARCRMYMPALVATSKNPIIKMFYEKLLENHKPKKVALLACERKLVMIAYGVLKSRKPFDPNHLSLQN